MFKQKSNTHKHPPMQKQSGQALVYGIFVLLAGLVSLYFIFNTGQLSREKTKLVNTSDAVAYSAGVMHARALNYIAYTNRAMMANETTIAQMVSLSSWAQYIEDHGSKGAVEKLCDYEIYYGLLAEPLRDGLSLYTPTCFALNLAGQTGVLNKANKAVQVATEAAMKLADTSKQVLQLAQKTMILEMPLMRKKVMEQVAQENYINDGEIKVDLIPLQDSFYVFDGKPIIQQYTKDGDERKRFAEVVTDAANKDSFVSARNWTDVGLTPTCLPVSLDTNYATRKGKTVLNGYDQWKAEDTASYVTRYPDLSNPFSLKCRSYSTDLGSGSQVATNNDGVNKASSGSGSENEWSYSGIPEFYALSEKALEYTPENSDEKKRDPTVRFAIRVTRDASATRTSDATSEIKNTSILNPYKGNSAKGIYASVSASEVYFSRPTKRADGNRELASLFNPYWQVHLVDAPLQVKAAQVLQGVIFP